MYHLFGCKDKEDVEICKFVTTFDLKKKKMQIHIFFFFFFGQIIEFPIVLKTKFKLGNS